MNFLAIAFGIAVLVAVMVVWFKFYKAIKADAGEELFGSPIKMRKGDPASLEEFVAAYRRGEISPATDTAKSAAQLTSPSPANSPPQIRNPFLSAEVKLAYFLCRAGLRDHHVFPNLPLSALCAPGTGEPTLSRAVIDLLICNAQMAPVAVIDVTGVQAQAPDARAELLKSLGIRYLRLSPKAFPKPGALHGLIYKM